jgi:CotH kinase protein/Chitobiase/beta-hexosaminidase C-terminal domain
LVVLDTFGELVPYGQKIPVAARFIEAKPSRSSLLGTPDFAGLGELNVRGHTSLRYPKHSYHFQTKFNGESQKVSILGFPKDSDWVLYAPYSDKTLIRDVLGYELSNEMGRYAARTRLVEVFLNDSHGRLTQRNYLGVYVFEEKIKRGKNRVDITKLRPEDNSDPNISGGYIIKKDHADQIDNPDESIPMRAGSSRGKDVWFRSSHGNQFFYVEPKGDEITAEQRSWVKQYINKFERVLYDDQFKNPKTGYAAFIDPESFIDHHLLVELSKNIDGFRFSTFYYKDRGGRLMMGPIWDWNLTFGNAMGRDGFNPEGWYWSQLDDRQYSWFRRLFEDPDFAQKYADRWGELRTNQFSVPRLEARIDELAASLSEAQARNFRRWRVLGRSVWPNAYVGRTFHDEIEFMKQWIERRVEWMDQQFLTGPSLSLRAGQIKAGTKLELRAPKGKIYYTLDGTDPRTPGGVVSREALLYKSALVLNESTTVFCRAFDSGRWSCPAAVKFTVPSTGTQH